MPRILYISFDGLLQSLGRSQVVPYLVGLSRVEFRFSVLSPEQATTDSAIAEMRERLGVAGIQWDWLSYRTGGVHAVRQNLAEARRAAPPTE